MFYYRCFFNSPQDLRLSRPIAVKLCQAICFWVRFINFIKQVQKFAKNALCKCVSITHLPPVIANISGTSRDVCLPKKDIVSRTIPPAFGEKSTMNELRFTIQKVGLVTQPCGLRDYNISALGGAGPSNVYTLQPPKFYFQSDLRRRAASSCSLSHNSSFSCLYGHETNGLPITPRGESDYTNVCFSFWLRVLD